MITKMQKQLAREYAASPHYAITKHVFDSDFGFAAHVTNTDKQKYKEKHLATATEIINGERDANFTVRQRMHYFLTGESVAFLPK